MVEFAAAFRNQPGGQTDISRGYRPRIVRPTIHAPRQGCGNRLSRSGFPAPHPGCISLRAIRGCYARLISVQPSGLKKRWRDSGAENPFNNQSGSGERDEMTFIADAVFQKVAGDFNLNA